MFAPPTSSFEPLDTSFKPLDATVSLRAAQKTPIVLTNNGVRFNPNGGNQPTIFSAETAQVLSLPSRGGGDGQQQSYGGGQHKPPQQPSSGPTAGELEGL